MPEATGPVLAVSRMPSLTLSDESTSSSANTPATPDPPLLENNGVTLDKGKAPMVPRTTRLSTLVARDERRVWSTYMLAETRTSLLHVLQTANVLKRMLLFLPWQDFRTVARASKSFRSLLKKAELRHIILSRFVLGYKHCLDHADLSSPGFRDVPFAFRDLDVFMTSQRVPLHKYPKHALSILSAFWPTEQHARKAESCTELCLAHSRVVLLLQSLVHSSTTPTDEEHEDNQFRSRAFRSPAVRELVFPAPLSYFGTPPATSSEKDGVLSNPNKGSTKKRSKLFSRSSSRSSKVTVGSADEFGSSPATRPKARPTSSVFGTFTSSGVRVPPPLPSEDTFGLRLYAGGWREHRRAARQSASASSSWSDGESFVFRRPHRRFASSSMTRSSASSLDESPSPSRVHIHQPRTPPAVTSPHDIRLATSRLRAPVLRVFHPCTKFDDAALSACEEQLVSSDLWSHLSTGDLVCNLGYLPPEPVEEEGSASNSSLNVSALDGSDGLWLLFNGTELVPYDPSGTLPLADPSNLPSPLYFAHIIPSNVAPRLTLALPQAKPQLALQQMTIDVPSPHSPRGLARTHRFAWLATVPAAQREMLGEGWQGEWVLEGEGTTEGRNRLLQTVSQPVNREHQWEMVPEKTTASRLWLRLLS